MVGRRRATASSGRARSIATSAIRIAAIASPSASATVEMDPSTLRNANSDPVPIVVQATTLEAAARVLDQLARAWLVAQIALVRREVATRDRGAHAAAALEGDRAQSIGLERVKAVQVIASGSPGSAIRRQAGCRAARRVAGLVSELVDRRRAASCARIVHAARDLEARGRESDFSCRTVTAPGSASRDHVDQVAALEPARTVLASVPGLRMRAVNERRCAAMP